MLGGGLSNQEKLYGTAITDAKEKMKNKARNLGADAVVGVQISTVSPGNVNYIIVIVNGTAVNFE